MEIYLIRHTKPVVSPGICYGQTELPLADTFLEEWEVLKNKLPNRFDLTISSPLQRCLKLAELIGTSSLREDTRLKELNFGEWEMKKWDEINEAELQNWINDFVNSAPPRGESFLSLNKRISDFWNELCQLSLLNVAVIGHAGPIRTLIANALGLPLKNAFQLEIDYGRVSLITTDGQTPKVKFLNA